MLSNTISFKEIKKKIKTGNENICDRRLQTGNFKRNTCVEKNNDQIIMVRYHRLSYKIDFFPEKEKDYNVTVG